MKIEACHIAFAEHLVNSYPKRGKTFALNYLNMIKDTDPRKIAKIRNR